VRPATLTWAARLACVAAALALCVIVFGAFVRLSHAGLSCPDWPTCYGKATWPGHEHEVAAANAAFERPVESHKTWREQGHRMVAGTLGVLILALAVTAAWRRPLALALVAVAALAAAAGIVTYMNGQHGLSGGLSIVALAAPLLAAALLGKPAAWRIAVVLLAVVIFQAMLGMWTVTWLLKPVVVMGHLLGGLATFALLSYVALRWSAVGADDDRHARLRPLLALALGVLGVQIALGGWTSANYAALACGNTFPTCLGQWWPNTDFREGFVLWRGVGVDYEGGVLDGPARAAIQLAHRIGALVTFLYVGWLSGRLVRAGLRTTGRVLGAALIVQVALGIANVMLWLPLPVATAHVFVAVVLLFTLIVALAQTQTRHTTAYPARLRAPTR
jgi:cytochrome c oxidase assembly protein subunit 15